VHAQRDRRRLYVRLAIATNVTDDWPRILVVGTHRSRAFDDTSDITRQVSVWVIAAVSDIKKCGEQERASESFDAIGADALL
jgi:hypothetical protein